jgi:hypothetical protein
MAHAGIIISPFAVVAMHAVRTIGWTERMRHFTSMRIEKVAIRVSPEDFAVNEFGRHLFATMA